MESPFIEGVQHTLPRRFSMSARTLFRWSHQALSSADAGPWSAQAVAVDHRHACAITTPGGVKRWGPGNSGELGVDLSSVGFSSRPVGVPELSGVVARGSTMVISWVPLDDSSA